MNPQKILSLHFDEPEFRMKQVIPDIYQIGNIGMELPTEGNVVLGCKANHWL